MVNVLRDDVTRSVNPFDGFNKLWLAFGATLAAVVLVVNIPLTVRNTRALEANAQLLAHTHEVRLRFADILSLVKDAETGAGGFVLTGDTAFLQPYDRARSTVALGIDTLEWLTSDNEEQTANLRRLRTLVAGRLMILSQMVAARTTTGFESAQSTMLALRGKEEMDALRAFVASMLFREDARLAERRLRAQATYRRTLISGTIAGFAALTGLLAFILAMRRGVLTRARAVATIANQRQYLDTTLQSLGDAVITTDTVGRVVTMNHVAESLTGLSQDAAKGRALHEVYAVREDASHTSARNAVRVALTEQRRTGYAHNVVVLRGRDGVERAIEDTASPLQQADGTLVGSVLVFRDVTEQRNAERLLQRSEQRLRMALQSARMVAFEIAIPTGQVSLSDNAADVLGLRPAESLATVERALTLVLPEDLPLVQRALDAAMQRGDPISLTCRIAQPRDGDVRWMEVRGEVKYDDQLERVRVVGMVLDVSERRRAEAQLASTSALLRSINDATPDYVYAKDRSGRLTFANAALCAGVGLPLEGILGKTDLEIHPNRQHALQIIKTDRRIMQTGVQEMVEEMADLPGGRRWFLSAKLPHRDADGTILGIIGVSRDITDRKSAEDALRESEVRFRTMADNAPVMIWVSDAQGCGTYLNEQFYEFAGEAARVSVADGWQARVHPDDMPEYVRAARAAAERRAPLRCELRLRRHDDRYRWMIASAMPRFGANDELIGYIGSLVDIEDRKLLESDLRSLAADLSEADQRKDEFLATLAHELRNPLAPLRNGLEIMRLADPESDIVARTRSMMERQLVQLVRLVDDLLDVSRISGGKLELRCERIVVGDVVRNAAETCQSTFNARRQRMLITAPMDELPIIGDTARLSQVFANLLDNASKYSPDGSTVEIIVERVDSMAHVTIRDQGQGIPPSMLDRVFELFAQVDRRLERTTGGLGIGLTLVKRLVEMHSGTIRALSDGEGCGSEFVVCLPLAAQAPNLSVPPVAPIDVHAAPLRVVIADDSEDALSTLATMLRARGHEVFTAADGIAAVALVATERPAVVLLDLGMPRLNGYEACTCIRRLPEGQNATLVALTGWGQDDDRRRSAEAGFDHHLVKPADPATLDAILRRVPPHRTTRDAHTVPSRQRMQAT